MICNRGPRSRLLAGRKRFGPINHDFRAHLMQPVWANTCRSSLGHFTHGHLAHFRANRCGQPVSINALVDHDIVADFVPVHDRCMSKCFDPLGFRNAVFPDFPIMNMS